MASWQPAYVGVGSNLEDPHAQVLAAFGKLEELPQTRLLLTSRLYRSRPLGPIAQPDFINAAAGLLTQLDSTALLDQLHAIERAMGRPEKHEHWGPRVIDLDLLALGREWRSDERLTLPHPEIVARNFVLYPLADIAPHLDLPGLGRVADLAAAVTTEGLTPL
ncbi:MAG: 2-amino-4-hydroxy-6-hydroxymethyldihydropteridine diphosphokinase [Gammaproteobacteria bacterium]|nr:2-amino-4-hydroxy-6-hydroxymethyldihydropteridine diphosphokinase [Gammaproteobacteria bacterium]